MTLYTIIFIVASIFLSISRVFFGRAYYGGPRLFENNTAGDFRAYVRRQKALKACQKYLTRDKNTLTLKNKNVILILDRKKEILTLIDNLNKTRSMMVIWSEQMESFLQRRDNSFAKTFDEICVSFTDDASYLGIANVLNNRFSNCHSTGLEQQTVIPVKQVKQERKKVVKKVNINTADQKELAELEGITIITAKKIIKYRELHDGFKTKEEFFKEMKIKPHFAKRLEDHIDVSIKKNKKKQNDNERIIDF